MLVGLLVRRFAEGFALRVEPSARTVSAVLFVLVLAGAIYQERNNLASYYAQAGLATFALNVIMMVTAYLLARWVCERRKNSEPRLRWSAGCKNGTLAIAIAVLLFWRRACDSASDHLQPDHVCDRADLCRGAAAQRGTAACVMG